MSYYDYVMSKKVDAPFYSLIMAAMIRANTNNQARLRLVFPEVWDELQARYNAPGGKLEGEMR